MDAGRVNGWWVVAAAAIPICYDLMMEPWRIEAFIFYLVLFGFPTFLIWSTFRDPTKE